MREACEEAQAPPPAFSEGQGFLVTFCADQFNLEYLGLQGLNDRQIGIVLTVRDKGQITNSDIQKASGFRNVRHRTIWPSSSRGT